MKPEPLTPRQKLTRAVWLAFQASSPVGLGVLVAHDAETLTEESLGQAFRIHEASDGSLSTSTDYLMGRMVKTSFKVSKEGALSVIPAVPRPSYQSWGRRYAHASELIKAVEAPAP